MKRLIRLFLIVAVLVGALAMPLSAAAGGDKVTLCHKPGTPDEVTIEVSVNALDAHLAHGDRVGTCTQASVLTCPFEATTIPVVGSDPVMYTVEFPEPPAGLAWNVTVEATLDGYLLAIVPSGSGILPYYLAIPGELIPLGSPPELGLWDFYVMKGESFAPDFSQIVTCYAVAP